MTLYLVAPKSILQRPFKQKLINPPITNLGLCKAEKSDVEIEIALFLELNFLIASITA